MKKNFFAALLFFLSVSLSAQGLTGESIAKINENVFEIIVEKHEDAGIKYERPLPYDRLPFMVRTDKYNPIGTAFLLEDGRFYSAAHVINLTSDSVFDKYFIRDSEGEIYKIDEITSYSQYRDFVTFTVEGYEVKKGSGLKKSYDTQMNATVYSVGNALGEGIVIRDGVLTSRTPEEIDGKWKWLRFSAAASPGNSGGPLVDGDGNVLGIVCKKTTNENLNYALPISEIENVEKNKGEVFDEDYYIFPNLSNQRKFYRIQYEFDLPAKYETLREKTIGEYVSQTIAATDEIKEEYAINGPKGVLSSRNLDEILMSIPFGNSYNQVFFDESGQWDFAVLKKSSAQIANNGRVNYALVSNSCFVEFSKPDNVSLAEFLNSPRLYTDYLCDVLKPLRVMDQEKIPITSFGEPSLRDSYIDIWGRKWILNLFDMDYIDCQFVLFILPVPTGFVGLCNIMPRGQVYTDLIDYKFMADYACITYSGEVEDWREFVSLDESILRRDSRFLYNLSLTATDDVVDFHFDDIHIKVTPDMMPMDERNKIGISTFYALGPDGRIELRAKGANMITNDKIYDLKGLVYQDYQKPAEGASEKVWDMWNQYVGGRSPYDGQPYNSENRYYQNNVLKGNGDIIRIVSTVLAGTNKEKEIMDFSDKVIEGILADDER